MPIRVIKNSNAYAPYESQVGQSIVIEGPTRPKGSPDTVARSEPKQDMAVHTGESSWAIVPCECTLTGTAFQLVFRREGKEFVLKSIDRFAGQGKSQQSSRIEGPFNWQGFACPECGISWAKEGASQPPFPVIRCSCGSLFCTRNGARKEKSAKAEGEDSWYWKCPKCSIDQEVSRVLNSFSGQTLTGK